MQDLKDTKIKDVMVRNVYSINIDENFSRVWDLFTLYGIRHLPVIDDNNILKGIITLRDLYRTVSPRKTMDGDILYDKNELDMYVLRNLMIKDVVTLSSENSIADAIEIMTRRKFGCIPITDKTNHLIGIVTHIDILKKIAEFIL